MAIAEWRVRWPRGVPGNKRQKRGGGIKMRQSGRQGSRSRKHAPGPNNQGLMLTGHELAINPPPAGRIHPIQLEFIRHYVSRGMRLLGPIVGQSRMAQLRAELEVKAQAAWRNR